MVKEDLADLVGVEIKISPQAYTPDPTFNAEIRKIHETSLWSLRDIERRARELELAGVPRYEVLPIVEREAQGGYVDVDVLLRTYPGTKWTKVDSRKVGVDLAAKHPPWADAAACRDANREIEAAAEDVALYSEHVSDLVGHDAEERALRREESKTHALLQLRNELQQWDGSRSPSWAERARPPRWTEDRLHLHTKSGELVLAPTFDEFRDDLGRRRLYDEVAAASRAFKTLSVPAARALLRGGFRISDEQTRALSPITLHLSDDLKTADAPPNASPTLPEKVEATSEPVPAGVVFFESDARIPRRDDLVVDRQVGPARLRVPCEACAEMDGHGCREHQSMAPALTSTGQVDWSVDVARWLKTQRESWSSTWKSFTDMLQPFAVSADQLDRLGSMVGAEPRGLSSPDGPRETDAEFRRRVAPYFPPRADGRALVFKDAGE